MTGFRDRHGPPPATGRYRSRRGGKMRGAIPRLFCKADGRKPVRYQRSAPILEDGSHGRWQDGEAVPRDYPSVRPLSQRAQERKRRKRLRDQGPAGKRGPRVRQIPAGTIAHKDMRSAKRAARRAGLVSARQQRRFHKMAKLS